MRLETWSLIACVVSILHVSCPSVPTLSLLQTPLTDLWTRSLIKEWELRNGKGAGFSIWRKRECLKVSLAMKRHHDHSNSYKGKHLFQAGLQFQKFSALSSWQETWQPAGRHDAGKGDCDILAKFEFIRPQSLHPVMFFLQQGHTYSNKTTPSSPTTYRQSIHT